MFHIRFHAGARPIHVVIGAQMLPGCGRIGVCLLAAQTQPDGHNVLNGTANEAAVVFGIFIDVRFAGPIVFFADVGWLSVADFVGGFVEIIVVAEVVVGIVNRRGEAID